MVTLRPQWCEQLRQVRESRAPVGARAASISTYNPLAVVSQFLPTQRHLKVVDFGGNEALQLGAILYNAGLGPACFCRSRRFSAR